MTDREGTVWNRTALTLHILCVLVCHGCVWLITTSVVLCLFSEFDTISEHSGRGSYGKRLDWDEYMYGTSSFKLDYAD
jgi:hypothetical protein